LEGQSSLPGCNLVAGISREASNVVSTKATSVFTKASISGSRATEASVSVKTTSITAKAATKAIIRLVVCAVMPLDSVGVFGHVLLEKIWNSKYR
jgi:hypothetical protein